MGFADKYFLRVRTSNKFVLAEPAKDLKISVVIPVLNEPNVAKTLKSILKNKFDGFSVEIIFVINSGENSSNNILEQNERSFVELKKEADKNKNRNIQIHIINIKNIPQRLAGAGMARKTGMDEALRRFSVLGSPKSIIVSLDADTIVETNYLQTIFDFYKNNYKICGANINFAHPIQGTEFPEDIYNAIIIYEIYLRYYVEALRFARFPYAFHTIGSAFSVRAENYAKQGGMVVNQSGEDFYFLQKIIPSCNYGEIKGTTVFPSPRTTDRVIFGTGIAVQQIIKNYHFDFPTYRFEIFRILKNFIQQIDLLFEENSFEELKIDDILRKFLLNNNIETRLDEIRANTKTIDNFKKRFFTWFNALKVLKFLNFAHSNMFSKNSVIMESQKLIKEYEGTNLPENNRDILLYFRNLQ